MELEHLLVEVRNAALEREGIILPEDLKLEAEIPFNTVGTWTVTIAHDHPLTGVLAAPGGGILVSDSRTGKVLFSGPTVAPEEARSTTDVGGSVTVQGITDDIILDDYLAWPDPSNGNIAAQAVAHDEQTGIAETLMHYYVQANIGADGSEARRNTRLMQDGGLARGALTTVYARFDKLLTLCQNLSLPDRLGFRVVQDGQELRFETYLPSDLAREVRLSIENDTIASARFVQGAPTVTRAIVAGKGGSVTRVFAERTNDDSLEAERLWGRRIERFVDRQDSASPTELERAGDEALADGGYTGNSARFEPTDALRHSFGSEWFLGDIVSIESNGREFVAPVTAMVLKVDSEGLRVGATLGDPAVFAGYDALKARLEILPEGAEDDEHDTTLIDQLDADLAELNAVTLPQLQADLANNVLVISELQGDLADNDAALATLQGKFPITATSIMDGAISTPKLAANAVTADKIIANAINAGHIVANAIGVDELAANSVNASKIVAFSISGDKIAANSIGADKIVANSISGDKIAGNAIDGKTITGATVRSSDGSLIFDNFSIRSIRIGGSTGFELFSSGDADFRTLYSVGTISSAADITGKRLVTSSPDPTGAAGNAYINSAGQIAKSTSSKRYKKNIRSTGLTAETVLSLIPRSYESSESDSGHVWIGFIAEEAHDAGLGAFVDYDDDGRPDGFHYATFVAAHQIVLRQQEQRITDLEARLARVEAALKKVA